MVFCSIALQCFDIDCSCPQLPWCHTQGPRATIICCREDHATTNTTISASTLAIATLSKPVSLNLSAPYMVALHLISSHCLYIQCCVCCSSGECVLLKPCVAMTYLYFRTMQTACSCSMSALVPEKSPGKSM
jgi:hypothetical protein